MTLRFLFATDLHGDLGRMRLLVEKGIEGGADILFLGGDLFRGGGGNSVESQRTFLKEELQPLFENFPGEVYTIFGNNDWHAAVKDLERLCPKIWSLEGVKKDIDGMTVAGVSYVPVTPFPIKDWERYEEGAALPEGSTPAGYCSRSGSVSPCTVPVERTLMDEYRKLGSLQGAVLISHGPPRDTCADLGWGGQSLGSADLVRLIDEEKPAAVLCGHIHEAPRRSGRSVERLGGTLVANPGSFRGELTCIGGEFDGTLFLEPGP
ncbi:MAG: metallophosphoesterase family protein [Thermoplasmatota archaeon]